MTDHSGESLIKLVVPPRTMFGVVQDPTGTIRIAIDGHLVTANRDTLKELVAERLAKGDRELIIDFTRCGQVDSVGLAVLVTLQKRLAAAGGTLTLHALNPDLKTVFEHTKLDTLFTFTEEKADG